MKCEAQIWLARNRGYEQPIIFLPLLYGYVFLYPLNASLCAMSQCEWKYGTFFLISHALTTSSSEHPQTVLLGNLVDHDSLGV